jgi:formate hydrogenlyase subunit 6/NADH:ubiquinone oxidoreductase subunit I
VETPKGLKPLIDLSRCIFCYQCADSCPRGAISSTIVFELASWHREELYVKPPGMSVADAA